MGGIPPTRRRLKSLRRRALPLRTVDLIGSGSLRVQAALDYFEGEQRVFDDDTRARFDAVILATGYATGLSTLLPDQRNALDHFDHLRAARWRRRACFLRLQCRPDRQAPRPASSEIAREAL